MGIFHYEEPPNDPKRCRCLAANLKEIFAHCRTFGGRLSTASQEEDYPISDFDEEQQVVVSAVRSRAMEKQKRTPSFLRDSFSWVYSPATRELFITRMAPQERKGVHQQHGEQEKEEFLSVGSYFSCSRCSSALSGEAFYSVKTNFSRSSSLNELDMSDYWRRSIIRELSHCEGWPFGLCRKAILLPPLPKSPSESWLWRTRQLTTKDS